MLALLHHPRTLFEGHFDAEAVSDHLFAEYPRNGVCRHLHLSRETGAYIVTAALPGIRAEEISRIELVGNRILHLEVRKKIDKPTADPTKPAAAEKAGTVVDAAAPAPDLLPEEVVVVESESSTPESESVVVMDKSLTLPQLVDGAGIACSYQDGLLRIVVPMAAPTLDDEHRELIAALEQEHKDAAAQVATLQQQLKEQKEKAIETQMALRSAQVGVHHAAQSRRHTLTIA